MWQPIGGGAATIPASPPPVRRGSRRKGSVEAELWRAVHPSWLDTILMGARELAREGWRTRRAGGASPRLGRLALDVLAELARVTDWATGRCEPSYDELAARAGASRSGVALALTELHAAGLLTWARRYEDTGQEHGPGPRVRQVSNAYALRLPAAAEAALAHAGEVMAVVVARARARREVERQERAARWAEARARKEAEREAVRQRHERASETWKPGSPVARTDDRERWRSVLSTIQYGRPPPADDSGERESKD